ncbi:MAG: FtsQ-type POTRA domain-containing protein [Proteobacteria bacterium]|nr:FtsQ-type POTRA domain-containing protein [Pseudomonadota bacterium]
MISKIITKRIKPKDYHGVRKKILKYVLLVVFGGSVIAGTNHVLYAYFSNSEFFRVTSINIQGGGKISKEEILEASGINIHTNILALDADAVQQKLCRNGWIESVIISKDWPSSLELTVTERVPVAMIEQWGNLYYTDRKGVVFAKVANGEDLDFPVISGLMTNAEAEKDCRLIMQSINLAGLKTALSLIDYSRVINSALPRQNISQIHVTATDEIQLFLANKPFPIYLKSNDINTQYHRLAKVLDWLYRKKEFEKTAYIYVGYNGDKVLVGKTNA